MSAIPMLELPTGVPAGRSVFDRMLWFFIGYCTWSCFTLPFIGSVWLGEFPVLAAIQWPKIAVASWLRTHAVMEAIQFLGFSRGSFSPDFILARPYALAIAYLIPMIVMGTVGLRRTCLGRERRSFLTFVFLVAAVVDYMLTLVFADGRSLTIY